MEAVQKEMTEAINKATADHELRMRQLQDRVDAMERTVNEVVAKNKEEEQRMRKVRTVCLRRLGLPFCTWKRTFR
jgi:predicted  nucleic acid-binding Zn-ribbon protein